jgi:thiosulfate dehydrogenase
MCNGYGSDGLGQRANAGPGYQFPPLGGSDSFSNGAGMSRLLIVAAYAMHNTPIATTFDAPVLANEDSYDIAAYIVSMKRPTKACLDKDFPIRLEKPVDTPYCPYEDGLSTEQHIFGPFNVIRVKVREQAARSGIENPGGRITALTRPVALNKRPRRSAKRRSFSH